MNNYNHHQGFITFVAIFILLVFAYIVGGGVVEREGQAAQASVLESLTKQAAQIDEAAIPQLE